MCSFPFSVEKIVEYWTSPSVTYILSFSVYLSFPNKLNIPHVFGYIVILPREVQIGGNTKTKILIQRKLFANKILQAPEWHRWKTNWRVDTILIKIQVHEIIM